MIDPIDDNSLGPTDGVNDLSAPDILGLDDVIGESIATDPTPHDPFPAAGRHGDHHTALPPQILVRTDKGESSGVSIGKESDGSVIVMGVEHGLGTAQVGDSLKASILGPDGAAVEQFDVQLVYIHAQHDRFFARIDAETVAGWRQNYDTDLVAHTHVMVGEEVAFTQQAGVYLPVLRHGVVGGAGDKEGELLTLSGTEGTLGSSGAPVFDRAGHLVGQVVAYDPKNHVNLISSAEQILGDIRDFRDGVNMVERAHPVSYTGAVAPVLRRGS